MASIATEGPEKVVPVTFSSLLRQLQDFHDKEVLQLKKENEKLKKEFDVRLVGSFVPKLLYPKTEVQESVAHNQSLSEFKAKAEEQEGDENDQYREMCDSATDKCATCGHDRTRHMGPFKDPNQSAFRHLFEERGEQPKKHS